MRISIFHALLPAACLLMASSAQARDFITNEQIDSIAKALQGEPAFKDGGHEGKIGSYMSGFFNMDWPVKNKEVRKSWDLDPKQDTDGDGTPDKDDEDIDGDGILNINDKDIDGDGVLNGVDKKPYDSTKQVILDRTADRDGDGVPDGMDSFPDNPKRDFVNKGLRKNRNLVINALW